VDAILGTGGSSEEMPPPLVATIKLPEVALGDFTKYLRLVRERYPRFVAARDAAAKAEAARKGIKEKQRAEARGGGGRQMGEGLVWAMSEVPMEFFDADYDLARAEAVQESLRAPAGQPATASLNLLLQEKLSHYLDQIEVHLLKEISARSDSFFQALAVLKDLSVLMNKVCDKIVGLREVVRSLDEQLLLRARRMQQMHVRRSNLLAVHQKVKLVESVSQNHAALQLLMQTADFASALDVIDDIRKVIGSGELVGLHCFRHLEEQVELTAIEVDRIMMADFLRYARMDVDEDQLEEEDQLQNILGPLALGLLRTAKLQGVLRMHGENLVEDIKSAVKSVLTNVLPQLETVHSSERGEEGGDAGLGNKLKHLTSDATLLLLEAVYAACEAHLAKAAQVRALVHWVVSEFSGTHPLLSPGAGSLTHPQPAWMTEYTTSANQEAAGSSSANQAAAGGLRERLCKEVVAANVAAVTGAVEAAHGRWAKLLGVRADIHAKLRLSEFAGVMDATEGFVKSTEAGCAGFPPKGRVLKACMHAQAKAFLNHTHQNCMSKMATLLESDPWQATAVDAYFQATASWLYEAGALAAKLDHEPEPLSETRRASSVNGHSRSGANGHASAGKPLQEEAGTDGKVEDVPFRSAMPSMPAREDTASSLTTAEYVQVGADKYHMVNSGLMVLNMLGEYIELTRRIPLLATEVVHRVAELLKLFNSRTCQLVLGAGAMQVSGLKSITAKHLALANQSITLILALLPSIRSVLGAMLPEKRHKLLLCELDRLEQDYRLHRDEIHSKLIAIMNERLQFHRRKIPQVLEEWIKETKETGLQPSEFAKALVKEIGVLQRVLSPLLLESELLLIFGRVSSNFNTTLISSFERLDLKGSAAAAEHVRVDGIHIADCLASLPAKADAEGTGMLRNWLEKRSLEVEKGQAT